MVAPVAVVLVAALAAGEGEPASDSALVVIVDAKHTLVLVDGVGMGEAPLSLPHIAPGPHAITLQAKDLPPFTVNVDLAAAGKTEVGVRVAENRPSPMYDKQKEAFDDAMVGVAWKGLAGTCVGCAGLPTVGVGVGLGLIDGVRQTVAPLATIAVGAAMAVVGAGLCGWSMIDVVGSPEEPIMERMHVVRIVPPGGAEAIVIEIEAPAVDTTGDPVHEPGDDDDNPAEVDDRPGAVDAAFRY